MYLSKYILKLTKRSRCQTRTEDVTQSIATWPRLTNFLTWRSEYAVDSIANWTVRYPGVKFGAPLQSGVDGILTDYWIFAMFVKAGRYTVTFKLEAFLPQGQDGKGEDKYLFYFKWRKSWDSRMSDASQNGSSVIDAWALRYQIAMVQLLLG